MTYWDRRLSSYHTAPVCFSITSCSAGKQRFSKRGGGVSDGASIKRVHILNATGLLFSDNKGVLPNSKICIMTDCYKSHQQPERN